MTVALPPLVASRDFLGELGRLRAAHPELRVRLRVGSTDLPGTADVDLAIVVGDAPERLGLVGRRVGTQRWLLAATRSYLERRGTPKTPADLSRHECLRYRGELPQRTWTLVGPRGKRLDVAVDGSLECDDSRVLGDATYVGLGIGVRPQAELVEAVRRRELVHVLPEWSFGELPAHLLTTEGRRGLRRVSLVADAIVEAIRAIG